MTPRATYRLQFNRDFTFADAERIVPYLARLGISHIYASPITVAKAGSTHGYDVVDPTSVDPVLGGEAGFRQLVATLREHAMGIVVDIVPNHMGVVGGGNRWWNDVLANGPASAFAKYFDIDWHAPIMLPVLGTTLDDAIAAGAIEVVREGEGIEGEEREGKGLAIVAHGEHRFPVRPEDRELPGDEAALRALLERQHYRLAYWREANDTLNWRRFFTINELAGLRVEEPEVFEAAHALLFRLYAEGLIDGVRVDHVDGLTDPAGYCRLLRARLDALAPPRADRAWLVIEKILGPDERLADDWGVDGTTGYDFMEEIAALLHDPAGEAVLTEAWAGLSRRPAAFAEEELLARQQLLAWQFAGQLEACVDAFVALAGESDGITRAMLRRATERLLWVFPVYRTYATGKGAPANDRDIRATVRARVAAHVAPGEQRVVDLILGWLAGEGGPDAADAVRRFQQLSAPIAAKSVEDTAFYRYARLLSRNDVGFDAARWSLPIAAFHARMAARAADWPDAMLTTATHDHKRGEDVRARLAVLSEMPGSWLAAVAAWDRLADEVIGGIDPADRYALWQTLVGSWPLDGPAGDDGERVRQWQQKALREAKLRSSWEAPDEAYEERCGRLVDGAAGGELGRAIAGFVATIAPAARANMLAQTVLRYTVPGVPDLYQGTECIDLSLVDPDNRRPVDYVARARKLAEASDEKLSTIARLLAIRRQEPRLFRRGRYVAASVEGPLASKILAFSRIDGGRRLDVAVLIHGAGLAIGGSDGSDDGRYAETMLAFDRAPPRDAGMLKDTPAWFELATCGD